MSGAKICAGSMPIWRNSARRRGLAEARITFAEFVISACRARRQWEGTLFEAECDPAFGQIIRGHLDIDAVTGQDADAVFTHFTAGMGQNDMLVVELYAEHRVGQQLSDHAAELD